MTENIKKHSFLSLVLALVLVAAMALSFVACDDKPTDTEVSVETTADGEVLDGTDGPNGSNIVGEGKVSFTFEVVFADNTVKEYTVKTDKETVGAALLDVGLISGDDDQYGLYVKTVDGVTYDYDRDKVYWSFYVDGRYAPKGVDRTKIAEGVKYSFKAEKA